MTSVQRRCMYQTLFTLGVLVATPTVAQLRDAQASRAGSQSWNQDTDQDQPQPRQPLREPDKVPLRTGQVADSAVGQVGQRQTGQMLGLRPAARLITRIPSRVQNRIRNRIDRNYDPQSNATSPFATAEELTQGTIRLDR